MKAPNKLLIQLKTKPDDLLQGVNNALEHITDEDEHLMWCSGGMPFKQTIAAFRDGDKPVCCWLATDPSGKAIGHMELHNNQYGWVIARVWVHADWRRQGVARAMYIKALTYTASYTRKIGAFCYSTNHPSKKLLLDLGFTCLGSAPGQDLEFFAIDPSRVLKQKHLGRAKSKPSSSLTRLLGRASTT